MERINRKTPPSHSLLCTCGVDLNFETVKHGLSHAKHAGRFEVIDGSEFDLPYTTVLDIAHNPHAVTSFVTTWQKLYPNKKTTILFGAVATKDLKGILEQLSQIAKRFLFVPVNSPRAVAPEDIATALPDSDPPPHEIFTSLSEALTAAQKTDSLVITGSAFLVGEAKALFTQQEHRKTEQ